MECSLCVASGGPRLSYQSIKEYLKHLQLFHAHKPSFKVICGIGGCLRSYANINTFRNHIYSVHDVSMLEQRTLPDKLHAGDSESTIGSNQTQADSSDFENLYPSALESTSDPSDQDNALQPRSFDNQLQRSSALMLLGLKEKHKLPQSTVQGIVNGVTGLFQQHVDALKSQVTNCITFLCSQIIYFQLYRLIINWPKQV